MVFNSLNYLLFLPLVFLVHYFSPDRFRWLVLLVASYFFYAALKFPHLILVLLLVTTITYLTGIWIDRNENARTRGYYLWGGISANILTLIALKYLPFLTQNLNIILDWILPGITIPVSKSIIAIGVSYFVFQAISYLVDIYLEIEKPERNFGNFALYMSFFPKLLQGPIERCGNLLPQFKQTYVFNYESVRSGLLLFALGLMKKVVIADRLALMVNPVFDNVRGYDGFPLLLASYYYAVQIYFDFSGYTDMALGTAMLFNINLTQNFNNPYFATSIADFWRRWHISFSSWILDYIFKPLQMNWRNWGSWGTAGALLVTFTVSGLWHGASWGFVIWGALHGVYMVCAVWYKPVQKKIYSLLKLSSKYWLVKLLRGVFIFNLVSFAWIFFRVNNINDAFYIMKSIIISMSKVSYAEIAKAHSMICGIDSDIYYSIIIITIMIGYLTLLSKLNIQKQTGIIFRWANYLIISVSIITLGVHGAKESFLYLKF